LVTESICCLATGVGERGTIAIDGRCFFCLSLCVTGVRIQKVYEALFTSLVGLELSDLQGHYSLQFSKEDKTTLKQGCTDDRNHVATASTFVFSSVQYLWSLNLELVPLHVSGS